ncbi:MAG: TMEM14 family protein [Fimbriimonadales bacterium]
MRWLDIVLVLYAILTFGGGVMGYVKAGSSQSIIASSIAAVLVLLGVWLARGNRSAGYGLAALVALALAGFFGYRISQGGVMPGVPALISSLIALGCLAYAHFKP